MNHIREQMAQSVKDGITAAMTEEAAKQFWMTGWKVLQEQTKVRAGGWVIDGVSGGLKRILTLALVVAILYALGGWHLVVKVWEALTSSSGG